MWHLLAKMDSSRGLWVAWHHFLTSKEPFHLCAVRQVSLTECEIMWPLISYPGRDQPLLLFSCYLCLGVHRGPDSSPWSAKGPHVFCFKHSRQNVYKMGTASVYKISLSGHWEFEHVNAYMSWNLLSTSLQKVKPLSATNWHLPEQCQWLINKVSMETEAHAAIVGGDLGTLRFRVE